MTTNNTLIIIPTYNEAENIGPLYARIRGFAPDHHLLFVDDGSKDGTIANIEKLIAHNSNVFLLRRSCKLGLASAYFAGFKWGLEKGYSWIQQMDADLSHDPRYLVEFEKYKLDGCELIIASRYIDKSVKNTWSFFRKTLSYLGCLYLKLILTAKINDLTGGFNCYNHSLLRKYDFDKMVARGYIFQAELKYIASISGAKIIEFPYIFKNRSMGDSKITWAIILEGLFLPLFLKLKYYKRRK